MPSINSARYAQRIIQTESHESPSFLRKVHRLDPPDDRVACVYDATQLNQAHIYMINMIPFGMLYYR